MSVRPFYAAMLRVDDFAGVLATAEYKETSAKGGRYDTYLGKDLVPRFVPYYYDQNASPNISWPFFGRGLVVTHNLPKLHEAGVSVIVDEALLQAIWAGDVTVWNDTAIRQLNPTLAPHLPDRLITISYLGHWPRPGDGPKRQVRSSDITARFLAHLYKYYVRERQPLHIATGVLLGDDNARLTPWSPEPQDYIASDPATRTGTAAAKDPSTELQGGSQFEPELEQGGWLLPLTIAVALLVLLLRTLRRLQGSFAKPWSWEIDGSEIHFGDLLCDQGAHGNVIRSMWQDREVAVKVLLHHTKKPSRRLVKTFREEVSAIASVRHPHVVGVLAASTASPQSFYIVLDYMSYGSLFDALHNDLLNFSPKGRVRMALDTARGMYHLHSLGITHSNLSSHNVLVGEDGRFRVSGFGLTRVKAFLRDSGQARRDYDSEWLAPELRDNALYAPHGRQADVYSFGVVMWEILTRLHPSPELGERVVQDLDLPLPTSPPQVPVGYTTLMRQCCEHHPADRPSFSRISSRLARLHESSST